MDKNETMKTRTNRNAAIDTIGQDRQKAPVMYETETIYPKRREPN